MSLTLESIQFRLDNQFDLMKKAVQGPVPDAKQRRSDLDQLLLIIDDHQDAIIDAINADFGSRSPHETLLADILVVKNEISHMRSHLKRWMKPRKKSVGWRLWPGKAAIHYQPLGLVGIIGPWNYPFNLVIAPLAAALAAGNRAMIKPSEFTPKTSDLLKSLLQSAFPEDQVYVSLGGADVAQAFSSLQFDHLFFTGSTNVGRLVMQAAAKNLTPVTLELGGKSPVILDADFPFETAARRICAAKFFNGGQSCIAPDYLLIEESHIDDFVKVFSDTVTQSFPRLKDNPDYTRIINSRQAERLQSLINEVTEQGARVVVINPANEDLGVEKNLMPPTLVIDPDPTSRLMQEEIFGPILPIIPVKSIKAALSFVNQRPRPLAFYLFSNKKHDIKEALSCTVSGGACINDSMIQFAASDLPFGGIGPSGMGRYHGDDGFLNFSHHRSVFYQGPWSALRFLRPPYGKLADRILKFLIRL